MCLPARPRREMGRAAVPCLNSGLIKPKKPDRASDPVFLMYQNKLDLEPDVKDHAENAAKVRNRSFAGLVTVLVDLVAMGIIKIDGG